MACRPRLGVLRYVLKGEPKEFAGGLHVGVRRESGMTEFLTWVTDKMALPFPELGKAVEEETGAGVTRSGNGEEGTGRGI